VENLFFAGRNISMTHMAMSSIRVMATCALLGEAVGKAVAVAVKNSLLPHEVYLQKIPRVQELLMNEDCFLPSKVRQISSACKKAVLSGAEECIRNGQDRQHVIYGTEASGISEIERNTSIRYTFKKQDISSVHIVFDSDLNRRTQQGSVVERTRSMRANRRLDSPQMQMPKTLCKEFKLVGELNGVSVELLHIQNNRKRSYHIEINRFMDAITLIPISNWGETERISVISFDFC
jgi:hypothetical protein